LSRIPQSFFDDLLNRIDIVDVIDHRVKLKKSGKNYSACCPFHEEKTPSFTVSQDKQFYYCFGCGATGSAITFLVEYERLGFIDAVESLARLAGVEVPRENNEQHQQQDSKLKKLYSILSKANTYYQAQLKEHKHRDSAVTYLQNRGLSGNIARDFQIGYAPPGWDGLIHELGQDTENKRLLIDSGLIIEKEEDKRLYDRFRHRIMFPIRDVRGRTIGFGGRVLGDDKPKYLNSPETDVFHKGTELYGLYEARQANRQLEQIIVVEGYMDVIALAQYDITNAVATLGTACGEDHLNLAFRYTSEIIFCFDGDNAGRTAAKRALTNSLNAMEDGRQIKFLFLAEGQDPDTLVRQIGKERFLAQTKQSKPLEEFLFDVAAEDLDITTMEGRARFSKIAAPLINLLPEGVFRVLMFDNLAKRTGLSTEVLRELTKEPVKIPTKTKETPTPRNRPAQSQNNTEKHAINTQNTDKPNPLVTQEYENYYASHSADSEMYENDIYEGDPLSAEELASIYNDTSAYSDPNESYYDNASDNKYTNKEHVRDTTSNREQLAQSDHHTTKRKSSLSFSPVKTVVTLLLEQPILLQKLTPIPTFDDTQDPELILLNDLFTYLQQRPQATQSQIIGYWRGAKGIEAQEQLTYLLSTSSANLLKGMENINAEQELIDSITLICRETNKQKTKKELESLKYKDINNLNNEEKTLLLQLIAQNKH